MTREKIIKSLIILMIPTVVIFMFFVISMSNDDTNTVTVPETQTVSESKDSPQINEKDQSVVQETGYTNLAVDPNRCRGCGRCVGIDPEHFAMKGNVAVAISEESLDTENLTSAIKACPADAINLS